MSSRRIQKPIYIIVLISLSLLMLTGCQKSLDNSKALIDKIYKLTDEINYCETELKKDDIDDERFNLLIKLDVSEKLLKRTEEDYEESLEKLSDKEMDELTEYIKSISN